MTYFDGTATIAILDPEAFKAHVADLFSSAGTRDVDDLTLGTFRALTTSAQLEKWRENRRLLERAAATLRDSDRVAWYGPSMGAKSFLTARLMEVWAHGTDIVDALGAVRPATDRIRHIAQLGFITRKWSYSVRGEVAPEGEICVELTSPNGGYGSGEVTTPSRPFVGRPRTSALS